MRGYVKYRYIHDPDTMLTFDLKVNFLRLMTWLCVQASAFLFFDIVCLTCEYITMVPCVVYIHELCMTLTFYLNIKIIFSPWIWFWQDVFALNIGILNFGIWVYHLGQHVVYILDPSMTLTFDLYLGDGGILSEFYSQFLSLNLLFVYR